MDQDGFPMTPDELLSMWWQESWRVIRRSVADPGHEYTPMSPVLPLTLVKCEDVLNPEHPDPRIIDIHNGRYKSTHVRPIGEFVNEFKDMVQTTHGPMLRSERLTFQFDKCGDSFEVLQQYIEDEIAVRMHIPRGMYGEPQLDLEGREVPPREPGWLAPRLLRSSLPKVQTKIMLYYTNLGDSNVYGEQITKETFADIRYRLHTRAIPYPGRDLWVYWMERNENSESVVGVPRQVVSRIPIPCLFAMRPGSMEAESSRTAAARQQQYQAGVLHAGMSRSSAPTAGPSRLSVTSFPGISQEVEGAAQEEAAQEEVPTNPDRSISASNSGLPREPPTIPPPSSAPRVDSATENGTPSNERGSNAPGKRRAYQ